MNKINISNRVKSLLWRGFGMILAVLLDSAARFITLDEVNIPTQYVVIIGLVIGEITKMVNQKFELEKRVIDSIYEASKG